MYNPMEIFVRDYSKSDYIEVSSTHYATCNKCGAELFFAFVNDDRSVWLQCINCHEKFKIDVDDGYTNLSDNNIHCKNCNKEKVNVLYGISKGEYNQNWIYVVAKCIKCSEIFVISDWHTCNTL